MTIETMTIEQYQATIGKQSWIETQFDNAWQLYAPRSVPAPEKEVKGLVPGRRFRVDRFFRSAKVIVELDGGQWAAGGGRHNTDKDREKLNLLTVHGYRVLRYSGTMLTDDPESVVKQVAEAVLGTKSRHSA